MYNVIVLKFELDTTKFIVCGYQKINKFYCNTEHKSIRWMYYTWISVSVCKCWIITVMIWYSYSLENILLLKYLLHINKLVHVICFYTLIKV